MFGSNASQISPGNVQSSSELQDTPAQVVVEVPLTRTGLGLRGNSSKGRRILLCSMVGTGVVATLGLDVGASVSAAIRISWVQIPEQGVFGSKASQISPAKVQSAFELQVSPRQVQVPEHATSGFSPEHSCPAEQSASVVQVPLLVAQTIGVHVPEQSCRRLKPMHSSKPG